MDLLLVVILFLLLVGGGADPMPVRCIAMNQKKSGLYRRAAVHHQHPLGRETRDPGTFQCVFNHCDVQGLIPLGDLQSVVHLSGELGVEV